MTDERTFHLEGEFFDFLLDYRGESLRKVAGALGVAPSTVSRWRTHQRAMSWVDICRLASTLDVPPRYRPFLYVGGRDELGEAA